LNQNKQLDVIQILVLTLDMVIFWCIINLIKILQVLQIFLIQIQMKHGKGNITFNENLDFSTNEINTFYSFNFSLLMRVFHLFLILLVNIFSQQRYLKFIPFESFNLQICNFMKKMTRKRR
jgi:hypothetical protein